MLPYQKHHTLHLLLTGLLLSAWAADGAQNFSKMEDVSPVQLASTFSMLSIVAKEGSSMLIECNVTGGHDDVKWYNSKGPLEGEDTGRRKNTALTRCLWQLKSSFVLHSCVQDEKVAIYCSHYYYCQDSILSESCLHSVSSTCNVLWYFGIWNLSETHFAGF